MSAKSKILLIYNIKHFKNKGFKFLRKNWFNPTFPRSLLNKVFFLSVWSSTAMFKRCWKSISREKPKHLSEPYTSLAKTSISKSLTIIRLRNVGEASHFCLQTTFSLKAYVGTVHLLVSSLLPNATVKVLSPFRSVVLLEISTVFLTPPPWDWQI